MKRLFRPVLVLAGIAAAYGVGYSNGDIRNVEGINHVSTGYNMAGEMTYQITYDPKRNLYREIKWVEDSPVPDINKPQRDQRMKH